ncbi:MAG: NADPH:quinone reductase [Planctomycetaceae bacterium]|nr:NADPH:quinone reductase [Planctomycetaceae bacterium]
MKAAVIRQTGTPDVIEYAELPKPTPGPTEVLVKVGAVAVNPIDTYIRGGMIAAKLNFPYIIGCDLAGTVEACGPAVKRYKVGDRVWGSNQGLMGRQGSFAEYAAVDEKWLYPTPEGESDEEAAAGALVGITAHQGLVLHGGLKAGEVAYISGGSGGVGTSVIQVAKALGARVITTAGNPEKQELCRKLGADLVLDYRAPNVDDEIKKYCETAGVKGVGVWFETQRDPNPERIIPLMAPRGRIIVMAGREARPEFPIGPFYVKDLRLIGFAMFNATPEEQRDCGLGLNEMYQAGKWRPVVGKVFPLSEAAAAHRLQEENTLQKKGTSMGKIVLKP